MIAAVIIEPVPGNMGMVLPQDGYLAKVRELTAHYGILLIFDEVMSGFRVALGGAQAHFGIKPDLVCLGKVIGGGLPVVGAIGRSTRHHELHFTGRSGVSGGDLVRQSAGDDGRTGDTD